MESAVALDCSLHFPACYYVIPTSEAKRNDEEPAFPKHRVLVGISRFLVAVLLGMTSRSSRFLVSPA
jgi:hypothetical protein